MVDTSLHPYIIRFLISSREYSLSIKCINVFYVSNSHTKYESWLFMVLAILASPRGQMFFFGLMPKNKIAVLTNEKSFGSSMIMEDTELLYVDEWCKEMLSPDSIKTLFQGGFFAQSVKHETPRMQTMTSGVFMTCNELPNFGDEQANVMRRLSVFETKALTDHHPEAPNWIKENAMECLVWMMTFINCNIELVLPEERFYERDRGEDAKARLNTFPKNVAKEIQTTSLMEVEFQEHQDDIDCTTELHKEILKGKIFSNIVNVNK